MIDWLWLRIRCDRASEVRTPKIAAIDADGNVEWQSARWLQTRGSHDGTMAVRPADRAVEISGSPAKFLQGHNVFGSEDLRALAFWTAQRVLEVHPLPLSDSELESTACGDVELLRVDVNRSYRTGSRANCLAWIRAAEQHGNLRHRGRGMMYGTTVFFGKGSRHSSLKAYCKGQELAAAKHGLPDDLPMRDQLLLHADDLLRIEVQMRARHLRASGLNVVSAWKPETPGTVFAEYLRKLTLSGEMNMEEATQLTGALRTALETWRTGTDLRQVLSRPTFYRYRKQLLDLAGVDIAVAPINERSNVVPLVRTIEAVPVPVPEWAIGSDLYWQPPPRRRA